MRKISGQVVSTKPISLSRAAKLISRFAAVDNGSSPTVSVYLQRAADAFNHLVQFHEKRSKTRNLNSPDRKSVRKLQRDGLEKSLDGDKGKDSEIRVKKSDKKISNNLAETNPDGDEAKDLESPVKEEEKKNKKNKKKRRKSDEADLKEKSSSKKSKVEAVDS